MKQIALIAPPWWAIPSRNISTATESLVEEYGYQLNSKGYQTIIFSRSLSKFDKFPFEDVNNFDNDYCHIIPSMNDMEKYKKASQKRCENYNYSPNFYKDYIKKIANEINKLKIKNIIIFQCLPFVYQLSKLVKNANIIYHVGCNDLTKDYNYFNYGFAPFKRSYKFLKMADKIITVSEFTKNGIIARFPMLKNKTYFSYPGFDSHKLIARKKTLDITYAGRVVKEKGIYAIINAMKQVIKQFPTIKLNIYGPILGANMNQSLITKKLQELPSKNINYISWLPRKDIISVLGHSKIFLYPVEMDEPLGLAPLEAMSCECLCIVSDYTGGYHEIMKDRYNCYVCKHQNSKDLSQKILDALLQKNIRNITKCARKTIKEKLNWNYCITSFINICDFK